MFFCLTSRYFIWYLYFSKLQINRVIKAYMNVLLFYVGITGFGSGGCVFALTHENPNPNRKAIRNVGGDAYLVKKDLGTCKL